MGLKDAAGNETLRKVKVYTPAVLNSHGSTEPVWQAYLKADSNWETQELRYAVAWSSPNGNDTVEVYNIYDISDYIDNIDNISDYRDYISSITNRGINNLNIPPISLKSGSTTSVATYFASRDTKKTFALTAVNKNGYQHTNDDGFLIFGYAVPNSKPVINEIAISPQYSDGEVHYWNDSTTIDIDVSDADGTDHLHYEVILETGNASYVYKNDDTKSKFSLSNILAKAVLLDNLQSDSSNPIRLVSGAAYALSMKVIDTWGQESNSKTGEGVEFGPDGFIYDTKAPVVSTGEGLGLDKREGYHYGIGDFRVKITDAVSGLGSYEASINGESKIIQKTSDEDIFYITDMPDGSGMELKITVRDNIENSENYVITIDKDSIAPVLSEFTTSASAADGNYVLGGLDQFPFSLKWSDEISGAYKLEYVLSAITESPDGESFTYNGEYVASAPEKPGNEQTWSGFLSFPSSIQESVEYSLKMRLYDGAGNASELLGLDKPLVIDRTEPGVRIFVISGFTENAGIYYLTASNPSLGVISGGDEDSDAGDISYLYRIQDDAENDYIEIEDLGILAAVLNEGDGCLLQVKVRDGAGNYGYSRPLTVIKDFEAPILDSGSVAINGGSPGFSSGERVAFDLSGQDGGSGIAYYLLWIGRDGEEEPSLSSQISGSDENGYVRMNEKHSLLVPPHAEVGTYSIKARAADRAGHLSDEISVSAQLTVNTESKLLLVYDRVSVSSNATQLAAWWKYFGEGTVNYYRYRVMDAATGLPVRGDWTETPDSGAAVKFDTPLTHGSVYRFEVVAIGDDGKPLGHSVSEGARIDTQAPVILSAEKISLASFRDVGLSWEIEEEGEELSSVMLELVYPDPSAANGEDSTANKDEEQLSANLVYRIQLPLEYAMNDLHIDILEKLTSENAVRPAEGELAQLYLHAADFAGNKDTMYLDSLIMDSSKPPTAEIMDDGAYINPDENDLRFNWEWSPGDPESGIIKTRYKFFRAVDDNQDSADDRVETITDWTEITDDSISIKLKKDETDNGSQVFLAIERENGVGLRSIGISDGIIIDWTGPKLVRPI